ncbi:MAG: hypothetical protein CL566_07560 [Alphaproteobacteria bacterium]|nr:hypothetical protein [Alphaproteobacteria bacterium]
MFCALLVLKALAAAHALLYNPTLAHAQDKPSRSTFGFAYSIFGDQAYLIDDQPRLNLKLIATAVQ